MTQNFCIYIVFCKQKMFKDRFENDFILKKKSVNLKNPSLSALLQVSHLQIKI